MIVDSEWPHINYKSGSNFLNKGFVEIWGKHKNIRILTIIVQPTEVDFIKGLLCHFGIEQKKGLLEVHGKIFTSKIPMHSSNLPMIQILQQIIVNQIHLESIMHVFYSASARIAHILYPLLVAFWLIAGLWDGMQVCNVIDWWDHCYLHIRNYFSDFILQDFHDILILLLVSVL